MALTTALIEEFETCFQDQARQQGIDLEDLSLAEYTQRLVQGLQALGAWILERHLEAKDQTLHEQGVVCNQEGCAEAGRPMRRTARRKAQVTTVFGEVTYRRGEYEGCCGHRRRPLDTTLNLRPGPVKKRAGGAQSPLCLAQR